jgi:hypothetical protein
LFVFFTDTGAATSPDSFENALDGDIQTHHREPEVGHAHEFKNQEGERDGAADTLLCSGHIVTIALQVT